MRYSEGRKQDTRKRLLKVAADAIRSQGPDRIGISRIMAEAGLTHGGFYAHFGSKDELVAEAITVMFDEGNARLNREISGRSPAEGLWRYIRFYLSRKHRDAVAVGCPIAALLADVPRIADAARANFSQGAAHLKGHLADLLATLGDADADASADSLLAALVGGLMLARAEPDPKRSDEILMRSRMALKHRFNLASIE
jgi:TetR/AcrR family transcriptional regulator, transcriptional repressor for nem operon